MDIGYLLALQGLRESLPGAIETFFLWFSYVADGPMLVALGLIVYWCISKQAGQFACACFAAGNFICQLLKNLVCVYRPWIRSDAVVPTADAIEGAGGYSFPSGHATGAGTILGSFAWLARKRHAWITVACVASILIIAFSRNFLGVHTPQDVLAGLAISVVMIALTQMFFRWLNRYDRLMPGHSKDVLVLVVVFALCIASLVVVTVKPYPMDYVDGALLVDPASMQKGSYEAAGAFMGMTLGWFLERRLVGFSTDGLSGRDRAWRLAAGVIIAGGVYVGCDIAFKALMPYLWAKYFEMLVLTVVSLFVVPWLFVRFPSRFGSAGDAADGADEGGQGGESSRDGGNSRSDWTRESGRSGRSGVAGEAKATRATMLARPPQAGRG